MLPQLRLAICGGALLVGLHLLAEYGLYVLIRFDTFTTAIVDQFQSVYNGPAANMLGGVLVLLLLRRCSALEGLRPRRRARYARVGSGAARARMHATLAARPLALPGLLARCWRCCRSACRCSRSARWLIARRRRHLAARRAIGAALGQTLLLARGRRRADDDGGHADGLAVGARARAGSHACSRPATIYVGALPGVIVALALVTITVRVALPLYQTAGDAAPRLSPDVPAAGAGRSARQHRAGAGRARTGGDRASAGRRCVAVWQTTMRLAAPGAAASVALVALGIANELTGTLMLAPNGTRTLATRFWSLYRRTRLCRPPRPTRC